MIEYIKGTITSIRDTRAIIILDSIGFAINVSNPQTFEIGKVVELYTYFHWNAENGPSIFGFKTTHERIIFELIIDCPQIGPRIALSILASMSPEEFIEAISNQNEKKLSSVNGIGEKKAEQMILHLKRKVAKLLGQGELIMQKAEGVAWHQIGDALQSLGYTRPEITNAIAHLSKTNSQEESPSFDVMMRRALAILSKKN